MTNNFIAIRIKKNFMLTKRYIYIYIFFSKYVLINLDIKIYF